MRVRSWSASLILLASATSSAACQLPWSGVPTPLSASLTLDAARILTRPQGFDWSTQRASSPLIERERAAYLRELAAEHRRVQAWPGTSSGWSTGGVPGIALAALGCDASDTMPNGPATAWFGGTVPASVENKIFFITREGMFLKVDKYNPTGASSALNLGTSFSKTYVSLSPSCRRAYLLADNGTLFVVDTQRMALLTTLTLPGATGGYGLAPVFDPLTSRSDDQCDELWVPDNSGLVGHYTIRQSFTQATPSVSGPTTYAVATHAAIAGSWNPSGNKLACPVLVYNGVIFAGDEAGYLDVYDTGNPTKNASYLLSSAAGIEATPAIEFQDGSYTGLTDAEGNPTKVPYFTPIYAFVNVGTRNGPMSVWVNMVNQEVSYSMPLYCDDNDLGRKADYLLNYHYKTTNQTVWLAAQDGGNVAMDGNNLPTAYTQPWSDAYLEPAETNIASTTTTQTIPTSPATTSQPTGLAYDLVGDVWVTNPGANTVTVLDPSAGTVLATYAVGKHPLGIAVDPNSGDVWVANQGDGTVSRIDVSAGPSAGVVNTYASGGTSGSQPTGIAVDNSGNAWVTNQADNDVCAISATGSVLKTTTVGTKPVAIAIDGTTGNLAVCNQGANTVSELNSTGSLVSTVPSGSAPNDKQPVAIAMDSIGDSWVCDLGSNCVVELSPAGSVLQAISVSQPQGIAIDSSDDVWVTSKKNNDVVEISNTGALLNTLLTGNSPCGVDVGPAGTAVADTGSNKVTLTGAPGGGPIDGYLRFYDANASSKYPTGSTIESATLSLTTNNTQTSCYPPEVWQAGLFTASGTTGVFQKGTQSLWTSDGVLTATTAPYAPGNIGNWIGGGVNKQGVAGFGKNQMHSWDVTAGIGGHNPSWTYAFALKYDPAHTYGNNVYFPGGPLTANSKGNKPPFVAPEFQNNPLDANPAAPTGGSDPRPLLTLKIGVHAAVPSGPVESMPTIDSLNHKVYVQNTNYLFCLDYSRPTAWTDTAYSPTTNTGTKYTTFNTLYWGSNGGATVDGKTNFVTNTTMPIMAFDGSAMYCFDAYPKGGVSSATSFNAALTRVLLPLTPGSDQQSPNTGSPGTKVANTLVASGVNGGLLTSASASGYMIMDPYLNVNTTGGGVYLGLVGTKMIYQFSP